MQKKPSIAAAAVLVIAMLGWWFLRAQASAPHGGVVLAPRVEAPIPARLTPPLTVGPAAIPRWTQSAADAAWCKLPRVDFSDASGPMTPEELESRLKDSPGEQQLQAEKEHLGKTWVQTLTQRGDERSLAVAALMDENEESLSRLTDLARHTSDPAVYAWAMSKCYSSGACGSLSARRWIQLDPGNAAPWIYEAQEASERGDEQALREAMYQIGQSSRREFYSVPILRIMESLRVATAPGLQMGAELYQSTSVFFSTVMSPLAPLFKYCSSPSPRPDREAACLQTADTLWQHADTLIGRVTALSLSKYQPSRDASLWAARLDEMTAVQAVAAEAARSLEKTSYCGLLPDLQEHLNGWRDQGEWGFLRSRLEGRDIAAVARRYRLEHPSPRRPDNPASAAVPAP